MIGGDYKGPAMVYMRTNTPSRLETRRAETHKERLFPDGLPNSHLRIEQQSSEVRSDLKSLYEFHEQGVHLVRPLALNPMSGPGEDMDAS
jgi:hypothetical protein